MKIVGSYKLNVKKEIAWKALNDTNILKKCLPGCESFEKKNDTIFKVTATNQIGPMNASFSGLVELSNIKNNQSYTLSGEGQSSVGFVNGIADVNLVEENNSTILNYKVDIKVGGKIAQLGSRLIDGVAKKMAKYFFGRFADIVSLAPNLKNNPNEIINNDKFKVKELKSNFLNKYIYSAAILFILLLVVIFYFYRN